MSKSVQMKVYKRVFLLIFLLFIRFPLVENIGFDMKKDAEESLCLDATRQMFLFIKLIRLY